MIKPKQKCSKQINLHDMQRHLYLIYLWIFLKNKKICLPGKSGSAGAEIIEIEV